MISFRDARRTVRTADELAAFRHAIQSNDATAVLLHAGELEQGAVDALAPSADGWGERQRALRSLTLAAAQAFVGGNGEVHAALDRVEAIPLPPRLCIKAPEGYLHYALDPSAFAAGARAYASTVGSERASRAVVIGMRSIGASLSAVVAAALGTARTITVRPHGPSGGKRVAADAELVAAIRPWLADGGDVLVADEGPGATGETFACVAHWLRELGVAEARIVLFPSGEGGMGLAPEERRAWFASTRRQLPVDDGNRVVTAVESLGLAIVDDLSWGQWRALDGCADLPAAPSHERLKYRAWSSNGGLVLMRYAGLGRWGAEAIARAESLADAGLGAEVIGSADGFVALRWIDGVPARRDDPALADTVRRYLAGRSALFLTGEAADVEPLVAALEENARESLGDPPGLRAAIQRLESLPLREAVVADARMQAHEWVRGPGGITKVDAIDHGAGTRLPGPVDAAWDVAGSAVELGMDDASLGALAAACAPDDVVGMVDAARAYKAAYAAACLGEAQFARWEAGSEGEARVLDGEIARYRTALERMLG